MCIFVGGRKKAWGDFFGSGDRQRLNVDVSLVSFTDSNPSGQTDSDFVCLSSLNAGHERYVRAM